MNLKIERGSDPFKKYWWVLLVVFGGVFGMVCLGSMSGGDGGSASASDAEQGLRTADGRSSLDPTENPAGAPGGAIDLSMGGLGKRKGNDGPITSSLFLAPDEPAASTATAVASVGGGSRGLADALRDISRSRAADPTGWGGQKAQRGFKSASAFAAPKANFGGLSGLGGGSSASAASVSAGSLSGGGFGSDGRQRVGISSARGLQDDGKGDGTTGFHALKNAARAMGLAARSGDLGSAMAMGGRTFDGGGGGGRISAGKGTMAEGGVGANLTAAPVNLKANDPKLDDFKYEPPPATDSGPAVDKNAQLKQMEQMMMMMVVGGIMSAALGPAGAMVTGPMMMMMTQMNQNQQQTTNQNVQTTNSHFQH